MEPTKLLCAQCAASDASLGLTQAKRLPVSEKTAPCTQYVWRGRSREMDDTNSQLAEGAGSSDFGQLSNELH